jgi:hypothetical protein
MADDPTAVLEILVVSSEAGHVVQIRLDGHVLSSTPPFADKDVALMFAREASKVAMSAASEHAKTVEKIAQQSSSGESS